MIRSRRLSRPLVLGCLLAVLGLGLAACGDDSEPEGQSDSSAPEESGTDDSTGRNKVDPVAGVSYPETVADGAPVVEIYSDFQCPICEVFASTYLEPLRTAADAGEINLVFHQFSFLDRASKNEYSSRSANAAYCVYAEGGSEAYLDFYTALFDDQPAEGTAGPGDDDLIDLAETIGVSGIDDCIGNGAFADAVKDAADVAQDAGVSGTPTVVIDGEIINNAELEQVFDDLLA